MISKGHVQVRAETAHLYAELNGHKQERNRLRTLLRQNGSYTKEEADQWSKTVDQIGKLTATIRSTTVELQKQELTAVNEYTKEDGVQGSSGLAQALLNTQRQLEEVQQALKDSQVERHQLFQSFIEADAGWRQEEARRKHYQEKYKDLAALCDRQKQTIGWMAVLLLITGGGITASWGYSVIVGYIGSR